MLSKFIASYLDRPHLVLAIAWGQWLLNVVAQWAASGQVLTWQTLVSTAVAAWFTSRPGDLSRPQVAAKLETARTDAAQATRLSMTPPRGHSFSSMPVPADADEPFTGEKP